MGDEVRSVKLSDRSSLIQKATPPLYLPLNRYARGRNGFGILNSHFVIRTS
jgi:hypothetical protein